MKAMIFAAGIGARLKELTHDTPKCLMTIGGVPMIERVIERLKSAGVRAVAINVHHHAKQVIEFVESKGRFGLEVLFSEEPQLLDTGGGLKKMREFFASESAFLVHNSDVYSTIDLAGLLASHRERQAIATLAVMRRESSRGVYIDRDDHIIGWTGEGLSAPNQGELLGFCGISVASSELFNYMGDENIFSIIKPYLAAAHATKRVFGTLVYNAEWVDIGTAEQLKALQSRLGV